MVVETLLGVFIASAYLALKLFVTLRIAGVVQTQKQVSVFYALFAAWVIVQAVQTGVVLILSVFDILIPLYFILIIVALVVTLMQSSHLSLLHADYKHVLRSNMLPLVTIMAVWLFFWLRALFLGDLTWDGQTYGLPRLTFWLHAHSVFVFMPTPQLNMFVNEWNAELNSIAYALVAGTSAGFGFGNLEVLLLIFGSIVWCATLLGANRVWAFSLALILGTSPAILGLVTTVKGDLLAIGAFVLAYCWLIELWRKTQPALTIGMLFSSLVLAVGSKISVLVPSIALSLMAVITFRSAHYYIQYFSKVYWVGFSVIFAVFSSRFWANWIQAGNPIKRISAEHVQLSSSNFVGNAFLIIKRMFFFSEELLGHEPSWALAGGMGMSVWFVLIVGFLTHRLRPLTRNHIFLKKIAYSGLALVGTIGLTMTLSEAQAWSFRYFAPGIVVLVIIIGCVYGGINLKYVGVDKISAVLSKLLVIGVIVVATINFFIAVKRGEILPTPHLIDVLSEIKSADTSLKRLTLFFKGPYEAANVEALGLDTRDTLSILAFQDLDTSLLPFMGSNAQNRITTVRDVSGLLETSEQHVWDAVVIAQKPELRDANALAVLKERGYLVVVNNDYYVIAIPQSKVHLTPQVSLSLLRWQVWNIFERATYRSDTMPEVESAEPVDTGFISQELPLRGKMLWRARFEGTIEGSGTRAGHVSLHGHTPVISLFKGTYDSSRWYQGVVAVSENAIGGSQLSFGLGGWGKGSGHLRLVDLEIFRIELTTQAMNENRALGK